MMTLLLSYGANPYLSTLMKDSLCYSGAAQRGCYAAIAVAAAHGQKTILHKLLSQPQVTIHIVDFINMPQRLTIFWFMIDIFL